MTIYTVHVVSGAAESTAGAERVRVIPDRFSWGAFFFGPLWLLAHGLWLGLALWIAAAALVAFLAVLGLSTTAVIFLALVLEILFAFEAHSLLGLSLRRRGYVLTDIVCASGQEAAERVYFERSRRQPPPAASAKRTPPPLSPHGREDRGEFVGLSPDAGG